MFVDKGDLERRITSDLLIQYCDDDNDGAADDNAVSEVCEDADRALRAVLIGKGYTPEQLTKLESDKGLRRLGATIGAELAAFRRPALFLADGTTLFTVAARTARAELSKYASGELRSIAEDVAGKSANLQSLRTTTTPKFYVRADPSDPNDRGPGGF
jgi:hypothetical protein